MRKILTGAKLLLMSIVIEHFSCRNEVITYQVSPQFNFHETIKLDLLFHDTLLGFGTHFTQYKMNLEFKTTLFTCNITSQRNFRIMGNTFL